MLRGTLFTIASSLCVCVTAGAAIEEWGPATSGFTIHPQDGSIEITGPGTYYFQSYDGETATDINGIYVTEGGFSGAVTVHVYQDPNDGSGPGARDLREINLVETGVSGTIGKIVLGQHLAADGPVLAGTISGPLVIDGDILDDIEIDYLDGDIVCNTMQDLTAMGTGEHTGSIVVQWGGVRQQGKNGDESDFRAAADHQRRRR